MKRELRLTEISKNLYSENIRHTNNNNGISPYFSSQNKFKFHLTDSDSEVSLKKYKNEIANKIKNLNNEQKKRSF